MSFSVNSLRTAYYRPFFLEWKNVAEDDSDLTKLSIHHYSCLLAPTTMLYYMALPHEEALSGSFIVQYMHQSRSSRGLTKPQRFWSYMYQDSRDKRKDWCHCWRIRNRRRFHWQISSWISRIVDEVSTFALPAHGFVVGSVAECWTYGSDHRALLPVLELGSGWNLYCFTVDAGSTPPLAPWRRWTDHGFDSSSVDNLGCFLGRTPLWNQYPLVNQVSWSRFEGKRNSWEKFSL